jgi:hypothetical protein
MILDGWTSYALNGAAMMNGKMVIRGGDLPVNVAMVCHNAQLV